MIRKPLFDLIRHLLRRPFRQAEVNMIDAALDTLEGLDIPAPTVGPDGIALIKRFEGCARIRPDGMVAAYPDPGTGHAPWTIGWGATGPGIGPDTVWTQEQCDARLIRDLARYSAQVTDALGDAPTTQSQFDALVSFHYNTGAIARATLTRLHRAGDYAAAAREFARWKQAGGRVLRGLVRRREAEARLYLSAE
jgi:GH24 family phage-related lysozyme (muramidase)